MKKEENENKEPYTVKKTKEASTMAQTVNEIWGGAAKVEISTDGGSTWIDISGVGNTVEQPEQVRKSGEVYTFEGDVAIITAGKREPLEINCMVVYTEVVDEGYALIQDAFEKRINIQMRWIPKGGATGDKQYETRKGYITKFTYPEVTADAEEPIMGGWTIKTAEIITSEVA